MILAFFVHPLNSKRMLQKMVPMSLLMQELLDFKISLKSEEKKLMFQNLELQRCKKKLQNFNL